MSALTREQVEQIANDCTENLQPSQCDNLIEWLLTDAALRAELDLRRESERLFVEKVIPELRAELTEARNAALKEGIISGELRAEVEELRQELIAYKHSAIGAGVLEDEIADLTAQLAAMTQERDFEQQQRMIEKDTGDTVREQLTAMRQERDKARKDFQAVAQKVAQQRRILSGKNQNWICTKLHLQREIERWRAKASGEVPTMGHGAKHDYIDHLEQQLAAKDARIKELENCR